MKIIGRIQSNSVRKGFKVAIQLGFGKPNKVIPEIINEGNFDVLVMGTHGHTGFKDLLLELPLTNCDTRFRYHCL
jgi:manganese transport protein